MDRKVVGFFIITFIISAILSIVNLFYPISFFILKGKLIYVLLAINLFILLAFFFKRHTKQRWLRVMHKITTTLFSIIFIIYLLLFLINQFHTLRFIKFDYSLVVVFIFGLFSILTYYKKENKEFRNKEVEKIKVDWLIYFLVIIVSAIISVFLFFKLKYGFLGFLTYMIPSISFIVLSFIFIILISVFIRNKTILMKKDYIFVAILTVIAGILVFLGIKNLGWPFYAMISAIGVACALIVLISILLLE